MSLHWRPIQIQCDPHLPHLLGANYTGGKKVKECCTVGVHVSVGNTAGVLGSQSNVSPEPFFCHSCKSDRQKDAIIRLKMCVVSLCKEVRVLKDTVETLLKETPAFVTAAKHGDHIDGAKWNVVVGKKKINQKARRACKSWPTSH